MAPTNIKTVHQTFLLHIESNLDRLGMLSPTHDQRSQQKTGKMYTYINHHVGTPKQKQTSYYTVFLD